MRVFLIVMVILLAALLIVAAQNPGSTEVSFITFSATLPLLLIILVSAVVGLLLGMAIMAPGSLRRATRLRRLDAEIQALEKRSAEMQTAAEGPPPGPSDTSAGAAAGPQSNADAEDTARRER